MSKKITNNCILYVNIHIIANKIALFSKNKSKKITFNNYRELK